MFDATMHVFQLGSQELVKELYWKIQRDREFNHGQNCIGKASAIGSLPIFRP